MPRANKGFIRLDYDQMCILGGAVDVWGEDAQSRMAIEEMAELTKELCKHYRGEVNQASIIDECADVMITVAQVACIYAPSFSPEQLNEAIEIKMARLKDRLHPPDVIEIKRGKGRPSVED